MLKSINLKFAKIKYSGDSIGRDIRVEIETLGKFLRIDKRIKAGETAEINREVGRFETDRGLFQADVLITVIERDLLFNDFGNMNGSVKLNSGANYPEAKRAKTWFRIGHGGERYLHTGSRSLGCMTVIEAKRWMEIYGALIKARKGDFMSIGVLEVID